MWNQICAIESIPIQCISFPETETALSITTMMTTATETSTTGENSAGPALAQFNKTLLQQISNIK